MRGYIFHHNHDVLDQPLPPTAVTRQGRLLAEMCGYIDCMESCIDARFGSFLSMSESERRHPRPVGLDRDGDLDAELYSRTESDRMRRPLWGAWGGEISTIRGVTFAVNRGGAAHSICTECTLDVRSMYTQCPLQCTPNVCSIFPRCTLNGRSMHAQWTVDVRSMDGRCTLGEHRMFHPTYVACTLEWH